MYGYLVGASVVAGAGDTGVGVGGAVGAATNTDTRPLAAAVVPPPDEMAAK